MLIVTLLIPFSSVPWSSSFWAGRYNIQNIRVVALLWQLEISYWIVETDIGVTIVSLDILVVDRIIYSIVSGGFNILFAIMVTRFCMEKSSKRWTIFAGILSIIVPLLFMLPARLDQKYEFMLEGGFLPYVGPIPFQFIIGLIIMRYAGPWKLTKPWEEEEKPHDDWWDKKDEMRKEEG